jgi:hypothetical protein
MENSKLMKVRSNFKKELFMKYKKLIGQKNSFGLGRHFSPTSIKYMDLDMVIKFMLGIHLGLGMKVCAHYLNTTCLKG